MLPCRIIGMQPIPIAETSSPWPSLRYFIMNSSENAWCISELFADHLFALSPKRLGPVRIERIGTNPAAYRLAFDHLGNVAILAILTANVLPLGKHPGPDGCRRSLWNCLVAELWRPWWH